MVMPGWLWAAERSPGSYVTSTAVNAQFSRFTGGRSCLKSGWLRPALVWAVACLASSSNPAALSIRVRRVIMSGIVEPLRTARQIDLDRRVVGEYIRARRNYSPLSTRRPDAHANSPRSHAPRKPDHGDPVSPPPRDGRGDPRRAARRAQPVQRAQAARDHDRPRPARPRVRRPAPRVLSRGQARRGEPVRARSSSCGPSSTTRQARRWPRCSISRRRRSRPRSTGG